MPRADKDAAAVLRRLMGRGGSSNRLLPPDFLESVIKQVGGPQGFAGLVAEIITAKDTSRMVKARVISDLMRVMAQVEEKHAPAQPLDTMDKDDLMSALAETLAAQGYVVAKAPAETEAGGVGGPVNGAAGAAPPVQAAAQADPGPAAE